LKIWKEARHAAAVLADFSDSQNNRRYAGLFANAVQAAAILAFAN